MQKNYWKGTLRASNRASFSSFHKVMFKQEWCPKIPFRIVVDHITIFHSSPMQHLRWSSLRQKLGNSWKLLLTVVS